MTAQTHQRTYSPREAAKRRGVAYQKLLNWIREGELEAIDISMRPGEGIPRYRISERALDEFFNRRTVNKRTGE